VFQPIQIASIVALRECEADTRKICAVYQKRRDCWWRGSTRWMAGGEATRLDVPVAPLRSLRELGSFEFSKLLMEKALVAVSPGIDRAAGRRHVRFALVENEQRIRQATRAIGQFLKA